MASWLRGLQQFRLLVLTIAAGVLAFGVAQLRSAPVDALPEFTPPYAEIQTEALGLSAEEVEQLITVPLEADLLNGVEGVETIRSSSVPGLSSVVLVFADGTDIYRARQLVEERLTQAHALPNVSKPPTLLQPLSSSSRVLMIGMSSETVSAIEQSVIARWTVRPRLMGVAGVANVAIWGMRDQQLQVQVDPARLKTAGVTLAQVISSAGNAQVVSQLSFLEASTPGTGGFVETPQQRLQVRHLIEKIADPAELAKVPVAGTNGLSLGDVATVTTGHPPLIGDAVVEGRPGLVLVVEKFPGTSVTDVTNGVESALEELEPGLAGIQTQTLLRPADYVSTAQGDVGTTVALGALLALVLLAALRVSWRALVVGLVTVPLAVVVAAIVLRALGEGFNALVLAGLAAAAAVVVDEAVAGATNARRGPLSFATAIVLLAAVPVVALGGRPGAFLAPLALAYVVAVLSALLVAVTVVPVLAGMLLRPGKPAVLGSRAYEKALTWLHQRSRVALAAGGALLLAGLVAVPFLSTSTLPSFEDRSLLVRLEGPAGTSSTRMTEVATLLSRRLAQVKGVERVGAHVGRAVTGDRVTNVSSSDVWVTVREDADYEATRREITQLARSTPGATAEVTTYLEQELRDVGALTDGRNDIRGTGLSVLTGHDRPLVVRLFGQDLGVLRTQAERVAKAVDAIPGASTRVDLPTLQPSLEIEVDLEKAQRLGLTPGDVRRAEAALLQGIQVGSTFQQQKVFEVVVQAAPGLLDQVDEVRNLVIDLPGGGHTTLGQVATVRVVPTPAVIERDAVSRRLDVVVGVSGRDRSAVAKDIAPVLAKLQLPLEYHAEVLQRSTTKEIGAARAAGFAVAAAVAALLLFQAALRSWRLAGLVFVLLPVAVVGGLAPALLSGGGVRLGTALGLVALLGLTTRASILLVTEAQERKDAFQAAQARLGPLATSALALAALMAPAAVLGSGPGLEVLHPMALTVLAGLVTCTAVTGFLLPVLCLRFPFGEPARDERDARAWDLVIDLTPRRAADDTAPALSQVEGNGSP